MLSSLGAGRERTYPCFSLGFLYTVSRMETFLRQGCLLRNNCRTEFTSQPACCCLWCDILMFRYRTEGSEITPPLTPEQSPCLDVFSDLSPFLLSPPEASGFSPIPCSSAVALLISPSSFLVLLRPWTSSVPCYMPRAFPILCEALCLQGVLSDKQEPGVASCLSPPISVTMSFEDHEPVPAYFFFCTLPLFLFDSTS